jgi:hypothetical protein
VTPANRALVLQARVWDRICRHIDGIAIGSTMAALHSDGTLELLAGTDAEIPLSELAARQGANLGYLNVALRLLADQGWVERRCTDDVMVALTPEGHAAVGLAGAYRDAVEALPLARQMDPWLHTARPNHGSTRSTLARLRDRMRAEWGLDPRALPVRVRLQVLHHLDGHLATPVMSALARRGASAPVACEPVPTGFARDVLIWIGWAEPDGVLTTTGRIAATCAQQYWYAMSYTETFARVPDLLFAPDPPGSAPVPGGGEDHVDRELDIAFSGAVFAATCHDPFLEVALPIFDREPVTAQPTAVVDTGCGNGALLETLYEAVRERTLRGREFTRWPLVMIGVEPSAVARRVTAERLQAAGIPHIVIAGDVANPAAIATSLREAGVDPLNALHVSKSVIHNRGYRPPAAETATACEGIESEGSFAAADGSLIAARDLVANLVEHLRDWSPLARRHGLLVIEAHANRPAVTARMVGRSIGTAVDATHGFSNQYLVESGVFTQAASRAGLDSRVHRDLRKTPDGESVLTIDHLVPRSPATAGIPE